MRAWVRVRPLVIAALAVGVIAAACAPTKPSEPSHGVAVYGCTNGTQTFTVPAGITAIAVDAYGAEGGAATPSAQIKLAVGGKGGRAVAQLGVSPGETLVVNVGCRGVDAPLDPFTCNDGVNGGPGGFNGGGHGGVGDFNGGGGGGGAADVRQGGADRVHRVLVAGGGGGGGSDDDGAQGRGGGGGGLNGDDGQNAQAAATFGGGGATQTTGGALGAGGGGDGTVGVSGSGGAGGSYIDCGGTSESGGGGGGGGYFGGGGGGSDGNHAGSAGGGGGSGFGPAGTVFETGVRTGDGAVVIYY